MELHGNVAVNISGYDGKYKINRDGVVSNSEGHVLKPSRNRAGELVVELRRLGQRDKVLVYDLLVSVGYAQKRGESFESG